MGVAYQHQVYQKELQMNNALDWVGRSLGCQWQLHDHCTMLRADHIGQKWCRHARLMWSMPSWHINLRHWWPGSCFGWCLKTPSISFTAPRQFRAWVYEDTELWPPIMRVQLKVSWGDHPWHHQGKRVHVNWAFQGCLAMLPMQNIAFFAMV